MKKKRRNGRLDQLESRTISRLLLGAVLLGVCISVGTTVAVHAQQGFSRIVDAVQLTDPR